MSATAPSDATSAAGPRAVSLVVLGDTDFEALALRSVLEAWSWRVELHRIGLRQQFLQILGGGVPIARYIVISCHGDCDQGLLAGNGEPAITPVEIASAARLEGRIVLCTGCETGTPAMAEAFLRGGCEAYVAPAGEIEGDASLFFMLHLFYLLPHRKALAAAVESAREHESECAMYRLFTM